MFQHVLAGGATWSEDQLMILTRNNYVEETYLTVLYLCYFYFYFYFIFNNIFNNIYLAVSGLSVPCAWRTAQCKAF